MTVIGTENCLAKLELLRNRPIEMRRLRGLVPTAPHGMTMAVVEVVNLVVFRAGIDRQEHRNAVDDGKRPMAGPADVPFGACFKGDATDGTGDREPAGSPGLRGGPRAGQGSIRPSASHAAPLCGSACIAPRGSMSYAAGIPCRQVSM